MFLSYSNELRLQTYFVSLYMKAYTYLRKCLHIYACGYHIITKFHLYFTTTVALRFRKHAQYAYVTILCIRLACVCVFAYVCAYFSFHNVSSKCYGPFTVTASQYK